MICFKIKCKFDWFHLVIKNRSSFSDIALKKNELHYNCYRTQIQLIYQSIKPANLGYVSVIFFLFHIILCLYAIVSSGCLVTVQSYQSINMQYFSEFPFFYHVHNYVIS